MSGITLHINGTGIDLPAHSETTQRYFEKIKASSSLEGFDKHYQATVYTLLMTVSSFFNAVAYGASALFESAFLAHLDSEAAQKNFEEKGLYTLHSVVHFVAGIFLTVGAVCVPDQVTRQITLNHRAVPDVEEPKMFLHILGGRMEPPQDAKETYRYLTQARDAKNLTDIEKHYKATVYACLATVSSFFNAIAYGAQAVVESALLLPLSVEDAQQNLETQGMNALNSTAYFSAGVFMSMEALVVPDQMCERIHLIPPESRDPDPRVPRFDPIPVGDTSIEQQQIQLALISTALERYSSDPASIPQSIKSQIQALQVAHGSGSQLAALPSLKGILAQLIFLNDDQDQFKNVLTYIQPELAQAALNLKDIKEALTVAKEAARNEAEQASKEAAAIRAEQDREHAAGLSMDRQNKAFKKEKQDWEGLIDQSTSYRDELKAQVQGLKFYKNALQLLVAKKQYITNGKELKNWIKRAKSHQHESPAPIPALTAKPVTVEMCNAVAIHYAEQDYSAITATVEKEREALHTQLESVREEVEALEKEKGELEGMQAKWETLLKHAESLQDEDLMDKTLL